MNRRKFIVNGCGLTSGWLLTGNLNAMVLSGKSLRPPRGATIRFLGFEEALKWKYDSQKGLIIYIPSEWKDKFRGAANLTYGLKIEMTH